MTPPPPLGAAAGRAVVVVAAVLLLTAASAQQTADINNLVGAVVLRNFTSALPLLVLATDSPVSSLQRTAGRLYISGCSRGGGDSDDGVRERDAGIRVDADAAPGGSTSLLAMSAAAASGGLRQASNTGGGGPSAQCTFDGAPLESQHAVQLEIRGRSSQAYPKKQYNLVGGFIPATTDCSIVGKPAGRNDKTSACYLTLP